MGSVTKRISWVIWALASLFYSYQYLIRVMPSIFLTDFVQKFGMDASTIGQFSGVYYIGYALMHLPVGIMLDRVGPKKVMSGCILITALGLTPLLFSMSASLPILGRLLIGIGSSAAILGLFKVIRMSFSEKKFSRMLSGSVTIGLLGAIYGGGPLSYMRDVLGYQGVIEGLIALGVVLAIGTYLMIPEIKNEARTKVSSDVWEVMTNGKVLLACLFAGFMVGPIEGFADVWGTLYLSKVYAFDGSIAASLPSMIFFGMCFGAPVLSLISEKVSGPIVTIMSAGFAMTVCFSLFLMYTLEPISLSISFIIVGISSSYQILAIYKVSTYVREHVAGLATAVANMIIMIFGYAFHTIIGGVVNAFGGTSDAMAISLGVSVIPIGLLLGTLGFSALLISERVQVRQKASSLV